MRVSWLVPFLVFLAACGPSELELDEGDLVPETSEEESFALSSTKKQLQYIVVAHPDDEMAAWSMIHNAAANYPVFIVLTSGEETGYCEPAGKNSLQTSLGEATPPGSPYGGKYTQGCKNGRIGAWHNFLNAAALHDTQLPRFPTYRGQFTGTGNTSTGLPPRRLDKGFWYESRAFRVWSDGKGARVVFDLGDGDLTSAEVVWAIGQVRARRQQLFPALPEYGIVGASYYYAGNVSGCDVYPHPDHGAIHTALSTVKLGVPGPQWGRTCGLVSGIGRVSDVPLDAYQKLMGVDAPAIDPGLYPNARRTGAFQVHYGWLAGQYWPGATSTTKSGVHMGRRQAFRVWFAP